MRNVIRLALLCGLVLLTSLPAHAQSRRGRGGGRAGGVVMGPDGPLYDTRSPEWRMSGGNIFVYQGLMEQKMEMAQQQYMVKLQQQAAKQQQQKNQANGKNKNNGKAKGTAPPQQGASFLNSPASNGDFDPSAAPVNHYSRARNKARIHARTANLKPKTSEAKIEGVKKSP